MSEDLVIINCLFKPSLIDKSLLYCKSLSQLLNNYLINIGFELNQQIFINNVFHDNNDNVLTLLNKISIEYETQTTGYIQLIRSIIIEIIIMTMRKIQNSQQILANNQDKEIAEIISYIDKNILNDFTLNDFAIKFNTSLSNLSKKFKNQTGFNFIKYIQIKRIESACRLLSNTCEKIPDIAFKSGYNDIKFFNEIFKKFIGKTPTQYRNTYVK